MTQQFFSPVLAANITDVSFRERVLPEMVIVEGPPLLEAFKHLQHIKGLFLVLFETDQLLNLVLQNLSYEQRAAEALQYCALGVVQDCLGSDFGGEAVEIAYALVQFGENLWHRLRQLGVYVRGYLYYQHGEWLGEDIILHRTVPIEIDPMHDRPPEVLEEQQAQQRHWMYGPAVPPSQPAFTPVAIPPVVQPTGSGVYQYFDPSNPQHRF